MYNIILSYLNVNKSKPHNLGKILLNFIIICKFILDFFSMIDLATTEKCTGWTAENSPYT